MSFDAMSTRPSRDITKAIEYACKFYDPSERKIQILTSRIPNGAKIRRGTGSLTI
jgi:hypothetical protein